MVFQNILWFSVLFAYKMKSHQRKEQDIWKVGECIKKLRRYKRMTQEEMAELLKV